MNSSQCAFVALEVERVLAEEAKERQVRTAENRIAAGNLVKEKFPEQEKPEPQARDKAAELVGGTNARYVQDAKKIERDAQAIVYNELQTKEFIMKVQTSMRIEESTFNEAKAILASLGMNFTDAVNIFVSMVVQAKGLPFEVKLPNAETLQAMQEVRDGKNIDDFKIEELRQ